MTSPDPSWKSPAVAGFLEGLTGRTTAIAGARCCPEPWGCGRAVTPAEMAAWTDLQRREYPISGMCDLCQDIAFRAVTELDAAPCGHEAPCDCEMDGMQW